MGGSNQAKKERNQKLFLPESFPSWLVSDDVSMIDIGANLADRRFHSDFNAVLERSRQAHVHQLVLTGTGYGASREADRLARLHPGILFSTAGFHPHNAKDWKEDSSETFLRSLAQDLNSPVVAIGEMGLDFDRNFSDPVVQLEVFEKQLRIARDLKLPGFIHERQAHSEVRGLLRQYSPQVPCVVHCFTGTAEEARDYLSMDQVYIGITGWVNDQRRNASLVDAIKDIPLNRLMIETDAPYLSPVRSVSRNEPALLHHVASAIASHMKISPSELAQATTENSRKFFSLPSPNAL